MEHERIETTEAKAKELRGIADRLISLGKQGTLHARRGALRVLRTKQAVSKLFDDVAKRFPDRQGGYTRIIKTRQRPGDAAKLVAIELVETGVGSPSVITTANSQDQEN
jgi:large subunit ribosomal protein L17